MWSGEEVIEVILEILSTLNLDSEEVHILGYKLLQSGNAYSNNLKKKQGQGRLRLFTLRLLCRSGRDEYESNDSTFHCRAVISRSFEHTTVCNGSTVATSSCCCSLPYDGSTSSVYCVYWIGEWEEVKWMCRNVVSKCGAVHWKVHAFFAHVSFKLRLKQQFRLYEFSILTAPSQCHPASSITPRIVLSILCRAMLIARSSR